ncbi:LPS export ABC transporter periplasmic protein LptC [Thaumasiovibrio sp. DFM-14]|uniref:LPS export ABC transporter periplasmic protein LptC n=1 Tax=Thaumasiovibrio sp. DFM-14 TaxID=3384792 RepID=UPI0039A1DFB7
MIQRFSILVLAIIAIGCGGYLFTQMSRPEIQIAPDLELPIISGKSVTSTAYSDIGAPMYQIVAQQLDYFAHRHETEFSDPVVWVYNSAGTDIEWRISSDKATLKNTDTLIMTDNVRMFNLLPDAGIELIKSDDMLLNFTDNTFSSDKRVEITGKGFQNDGTGIIGSFELYQATLLKQVKGRYESFIR